MKNISLILLLLFVSIITKSQTQSTSKSITYFKASQAYVLFKNNSELSGPVKCDDIVLFVISHKEIMILSTSAKVYRILNTKAGKADNGNFYIEYAVTSDGIQATITYLKVKNNDLADTRIIINDSKYGMSVLDGNINKVL